MRKDSQSEISDSFKNLSKELTNSLTGIANNSFKIISLDLIDCSHLPDSSIGNEIFAHENYKDFFKQLDEIKNPIVYWFEIVSNHSNQEIFDKLIQFRNSKVKNFPALKKAFDNNTRTLYVGKKKHHISSRMFVHLGYYKVVGTQGLQLCYWAKEIGLKLKLNIIELPFNQLTANLTSHYEIELARLLKPLAGKHR